MSGTEKGNWSGWESPLGKMGGYSGTRWEAIMRRVR